MVDYKFELQYTISLFVMVFAAITAGFHAYVYSYDAFFVFGISQLIWLSVSRSSKEPRLSESLSQESADTALEVSTILFSAAAVFVISEQVLFTFTRCFSLVVMIPFTAAFVASFPLFRNIQKSRYWRRIIFQVNPTEIKVYDKYEDDSITLYLKNETRRERSIQIDIKIPNGISMRVNGGEDVLNKHQEQLDLYPGKEIVRELSFKHSGEKSVSSFLEIGIRGEKGSLRTSAKLIKR
ncbi:MAG: hypothetical protein KIY09_09280 [Thermoplasmata archaeon]|nr:hypothetical protein [Candidatus Sysuiplasma acidicola]